MAAALNARIRSMDIPTIDRVFGMEGGMLNFSNRTFAYFFHEEFGAGIYGGRLEATTRRTAFAAPCSG